MSRPPSAAWSTPKTSSSHGGEIEALGIHAVHELGVVAEGRLRTAPVDPRRAAERRCKPDPERCPGSYPWRPEPPRYCAATNPVRTERCGEARPRHRAAVTAIWPRMPRSRARIADRLKHGANFEPASVETWSSPGRRTSPGKNRVERDQPGDFLESRSLIGQHREQPDCDGRKRRQASQQPAIDTLVQDWHGCQLGLSPDQLYR